MYANAYKHLKSPYSPELSEIAEYPKSSGTVSAPQKPGTPLC